MFLSFPPCIKSLNMFVSQELFDETLLESQELFEYSDEQAVEETISELLSSAGGGLTVRLDHLSLTHPSSEQGTKDRKQQSDFLKAVEENDIDKAVEIVQLAMNESKKSVHRFQGLALAKGVLSSSSDSSIIKRIEDGDTNKSDNIEDIRETIKFILALLPESTANHPMAREIKLQLSNSLLQEWWYTMFQNHDSLQVQLLLLSRILCNACEPNKKTFVQTALKYQNEANKGKNGLDIILKRLPDVVSAEETSDGGSMIILETSRLITVIGKFQASAEPPPKDGEAPVVSSAHANAKELYKCGAVARLHSLARQCTNGDKEELLCSLLSALRVLAIDNDIVLNMVTVGILETADASLLSNKMLSPSLAAATLGIMRNLCANDEIKTNICKKSLNPILHVMQTHQSQPLVQEHGCGILAAMALRQPNNATAIVEANGAVHILTAMRSFPNNVPVQRQGCLAIRNVVSRLSVETKQVVLDAGADNVLRDIASKHQGSIEEAYAALRDLGCAAVMYKVDESGNAQGTQLFGTVKSNFRPVYD